jgi:hypothetical protein
MFNECAFAEDLLDRIQKMLKEIADVERDSEAEGPLSVLKAILQAAEAGAAVYRDMI